MSSLYTLGRPSYRSTFYMNDNPWSLPQHRPPCFSTIQRPTQIHLATNSLFVARHHPVKHHNRRHPLRFQQHLPRRRIIIVIISKILISIRVIAMIVFIILVRRYYKCLYVACRPIQEFVQRIRIATRYIFHHYRYNSSVNMMGRGS